MSHKSQLGKTGEDLVAAMLKKIESGMAK